MGMKQNSRIEWIDVAKGIGILLVLAGHAPRDVMRTRYISIDFIYYFIYSFHMPLFFFLAGVVYEHTKRKKLENRKLTFVAGKAKSLLVPWVSFSVLIYVVIIILNKVPVIQGMLEGTFMESMSLGDYVYANLFAENPYSIHVWYMYILFIIQAMVYLYDWFLRYILKRDDTAGAFGILMLLNVGAYFFLAYGQTAQKVWTYMIYYIMGILYRKVRQNKEPVFSVLYLPGIVISCCYVWCLSMENLQHPAGRWVVYQLQNYVGAPMMILLVVSIANSLLRMGRSKCFKWLGERSFTIYLLHQPFACAVVGTLLVKLLPSTYFCYVLIMAVCIVCSIFVPIVITDLGYRLGVGKILKTFLGVEKRRN